MRDGEPNRRRVWRRASGLLQPDGQAARVLPWWSAMPRMWKGSMHLSGHQTTWPYHAILVRQRGAFLQAGPDRQLHQLDRLWACLQAIWPLSRFCLDLTIWINISREDPPFYNNQTARIIKQRDSRTPFENTRFPN